MTRAATCALLLALHAVLAGQAPTAPAGIQVKVIRVPDFWGAFAIWGATGVDRRGRLWLGVTSNDEGTGSAHLMEFDPASGTFSDGGDVVGQLARAGVKRPGERQMKIHSRIVTAADGALYFASMDESGENPDGSALPTWGGHLWRIRGPAARWEHLLRTPEALIAVATGGPYVYALGYFNHVLYQYDTRNGRQRSLAVGAAGGHVSRNFFADGRGHVFVPRVGGRAGGALSAALVEYDARLGEMNVHPLTHYFERGLDDSHGIVGTHPDGAGGWYFSTGKGRLYQVAVQNERPLVADLGWFHPAGARYTASMFRDARGRLHGAASPSSGGSRTFEWISRAPDGHTTVQPLPYGDAPRFPEPALLYGSISSDSAGRFYVVGTMAYKPVVLQVMAADAR